MGNNEDLRIIKTKLSIKNALFGLLKEKTLEQITVTDICNSAMINRGTFYFHYKDKFDLMDQIENEVLEQIYAFASLITVDTIDKAQKEHQPMPHLIPVLSYIEENPEFFQLTLQYHTAPSFLEKVATIYFEKTLDILRFPEDSWMKYRKAVSIAVMTSILKQWVSSGMKEPKESLAEWITQLVTSNLKFM